MKNKNILICVIALLALTTIAMAAIPPPPADQSIGFYDTNVNLLTATACHDAACHGADDTAIADRHHLLVPSQWNCQNCHLITPGQGTGVTVERDCVQCHNGTAWLGGSTGLDIGVPHHNSTKAQDRQCGNATGCHGGFVDNYDDGHYMPSYGVSMITPNTSYNVFNATSGRYWGGCYACHQPNVTADPDINSNGRTHHDAFSLVSAGSLEGKCLWCHNSPKVLDIRRCEDCHSVKTLHNIQVDYVANGPLGKGHINNNWDCNGCHAFWDAGDNTAFGIVVPDLTTMTPTKVTAGTAFEMAITGKEFIQGTYSTVVSVDGVIYQPIAGSLTNTGLRANIPALDAGVHEVKLVKGGETMSQTKGLTAFTQVSITSAQLASGTLTLVGTGFGTMPVVDAQHYVLVEHAGVQYMANSITSWTDTEIVAKSSLAANDDKVTVLATGGSTTATIVAGTVPPTPGITVTSPNGGEEWERGSKQTITWDKVGEMGANVKIQLVKGTSVTTIKSSTPNIGSYSWSISSRQSSDYKIRITSVNAKRQNLPIYKDESDGTFAITR